MVSQDDLITIYYLLIRKVNNSSSVSPEKYSQLNNLKNEYLELLYLHYEAKKFNKKDNEILKRIYEIVDTFNSIIEM